jgi:phytol kinase
MSSQFLYLLLFLGLLLILIIITELLHKFFKVSTEQSRKFLHVSGGLMCLLFPSFFQSHWWLLPLVTLSFLLLFITYKLKMLPSIHQTKRSTVGSILFPVPVYCCFLAAELMHNNLFYYLPISLLTISDTAAETGGHQWGHLSKQFFKGQKTLAGSLSFFITSLPVIFAWLYFGYHWPLLDILFIGLFIAIAATITELITLHGWDNLSVPVVVAGILFIHQSV